MSFVPVSNQARTRFGFDRSLLTEDARSLLRRPGKVAAQKFRQIEEAVVDELQALDDPTGETVGSYCWKPRERR